MRGTTPTFIEHEYALISPGTKNIFIEEKRHTGIPPSPQGQCKGQAMAEPILIVHNL